MTSSAPSAHRPTVPPSGFGRTFLVGGSIVLAGLTGFYMSMLRNKHKQELMGTNPHFEQIVGHVSKAPPADQPLPKLNATYSDVPPAYPTKEHVSRHTTFANFKDSPGYLEGGPATRYMEPTPQRPKNDGTGRAYTKSPNYVDNYGKTTRPSMAKVPALAQDPVVDV
ncbi:hypothetical protein JR316_0008807 [Psilocybe cubensis]|uniref:Uncharacterized protein n=2 Tax=Psilocybe cubensis TaxID=181762 RepID=A0A8H7XYJ6_PSICU|nr:hypothetical protein JR316_0008807 [Psilocybe cubensis]KAH9478353.1 hypothetical protein JR316_0008807 [Psilocybe cubensis]